MEVGAFLKPTTSLFKFVDGFWNACLSKKKMKTKQQKMP